MSKLEMSANKAITHTRCELNKQLMYLSSFCLNIQELPLPSLNFDHVRLQIIAGQIVTADREMTAQSLREEPDSRAEKSREDRKLCRIKRCFCLL